MYCNDVTKKTGTRQAVKQSNFVLYFILCISSIKVIILFNIEPVFLGYAGGAWLGSDGESYLKGLDAIREDGLFTKSNYMSYFAPGYSLFLLLTSFVSKYYLLPLVSIIQTVFYAFSIHYLAKQLSVTSISKVVPLFSVVAMLNPTLSLQSLQLAYEGVVASICALVTGLFIKSTNSTNNKSSNYDILFASLLLGISIWLSPRMVLPSLGIILFWIFIINKNKKLIFSLVALFIILVSQFSIMARNYIANGTFTSQTSIGTLALMGAGPNATGTYMEKSSGIICNTFGLSDSEKTSKQLSCAATWYLNNPLDGAELLWKKSYYLWSPWFGPLQGGTNARNPYLNFHPVKANIKTQEQVDIVFGIPGQLVSWFWILGGWFFLISGLKYLWKSDDLSRKISLIAAIFIFSNWATVLIVQGDNRYRIPLMTISILVQVVGWKNFTLRVKKLL